MDKIGVILAISPLLVTIQSTFYFLGRLKVKMIEWIVLMRVLLQILHS
jgi:hypothetical protein